MLRKILKISLCLFLSICMINQIYAKERKGSLEIHFKTKESSQISFSIYKIGECRDGSLVQYDPINNFIISKDLNNIKTAKDCEDIIEECLNQIYDQDIDPYQQQVVDKNGQLVFHDLEIGLYLMTQNEYSKDFQAENILFAIPTMVDGEVIYDREASPKYITNENQKEENDKKDNIKTNDPTPIYLYSGLFISSLFLLKILRKMDKQEG